MSELKQVQCPACEATLRFRRTASAIVALTCPTCNHAFEVRLPTTVPNPAVKPPAPIAKAIQSNAIQSSTGQTKQPVIAKPILAKPVASASPAEEPALTGETGIPDFDFGNFCEPTPSGPEQRPQIPNKNLHPELPWLLPVAVAGGIGSVCLIVAIIMFATSDSGKNALASLMSEEETIAADSAEKASDRSNAISRTDRANQKPDTVENAPRTIVATESAASTSATNRVEQSDNSRPIAGSARKQVENAGSLRETPADFGVTEPGISGEERLARAKSYAESVQNRALSRVGGPPRAPTGVSTKPLMLSGPTSLTICVSSASSLDGNMIRDRIRRNLSSRHAAVTTEGTELTLNFRYAGTLADATKFIDFGRIDICDSQSRTIYVDASRHP